MLNKAAEGKVGRKKGAPVEEEQTEQEQIENNELDTVKDENTTTEN